MSIKEQFEIKPVPLEITRDWLLNKHYAGRVPMIIHCFGLYNETKSLVGVCTFGMPSRQMNNGECVFESIKIKTLELNRLVTNEGLPKNTLSYFISKTFSYLEKPCCLVSYADSNFGHHGYIYQATNWIYTGKTEPRSKFVDKDGKDIHERTLWSRYGSESSALKTGEVIKTKQDGKHRYFKFLGNKKEVAQMKREFMYQISPYPKGKNERYDASYQPIQQGVLL